MTNKTCHLSGFVTATRIVWRQPPFYQGHNVSKGKNVCFTACASPPRRPRKPKGYWNDVENIRKEIINLQPNRVDQSLSALPAPSFLRSIGRRDIDTAISNMGGYHKVADMLGFTTSSSRKPQGYWNDIENLKAELSNFLSAQNVIISEAAMPTLKELRAANRSDIAKGISLHGGTAAVASKIGLKPTTAKKVRYYWKDWDKVEHEIRTFVAQRAKHLKKLAREESIPVNKRQALRMPSQRELLTAGRGDLAEAISDYHGGFRSVANKLGLISGKKDDFFYNEFCNLARELYMFSREIGCDNVMPSSTVLKSEGRTDLLAAITKFGGMSSVSQRLGLQYRVRTSEVFKDWSIFRRSLLFFMEAQGNLKELPSSRKLINFGRSDLYQAILHHGGMRTVADRMGLKRNYWQDFHHVAIQVLQFIATHGTEGVMPTEQEFADVGRGALNVAVAKFGYSQVAKRLGLKEPPQATRLAFDTLLNHDPEGFDL